MPKGKRTLVRFKGRTVCLAEAARMANMPKDRLMGRIKNGVSFKDAISDPSPKTVTNAIDVTIDGETHHIAEWCRILGIHQSTVCARIKKGMTYEEALSTPNKCSPEASRRERRWQVMSILLGGSAQLIKGRVCRGWDVKLAESTPVSHTWERKSKYVFNARNELIKLGILV